MRGMPTKCLSVLDHSVKLAKRLNSFLRISLCSFRYPQYFTGNFETPLSLQLKQDLLDCT